MEIFTFRLIVDRGDEVYVVTENYPAQFSSFVCDNETVNGESYDSTYVRTSVTHFATSLIVLLFICH